MVDCYNLQEFTDIRKEGKNGSDRLISPNSVSIRIKFFTLFFTVQSVIVCLRFSKPVKDARMMKNFKDLYEKLTMFDEVV